MILLSHQKRKIIHIDMDAFYASVEQYDNPALRGKPIAVGGGEKRGVTTTASYEARKYGVRSAMPGYLAKQKCPDLIFVPPRFERYKEVSKIIRSIFSQYTDLIEPLSLDEAYLDVTDNKINEPVATTIAKSIQADIFKQTGLTCSAGVSYCKFIAKIASDINKPNGITIIKPHQAIKFIEKLPIEKFFGIGKVTAKKMHEMHVSNGHDLKAWDKLDLIKQFGKAGAYYYDIVRGVDERPVVSERQRKSLAVERTMDEDISDIKEMGQVIKAIAEKLWSRMQKSQYFGKTVTLKIKSSDFQVITRSKSLNHNIQDGDLLASLAHQLLLQNNEAFNEVRLIGLTVSNQIKEDKNHSSQIRLKF
jgi:DNA polymerase-4